MEKAVDELESHSRELGEINKVLSEIGSLKEGLADNLSTLEENNKGFEAVTGNLKSSVAESLTQLTSKADEIYDNNKKFYKEMDSLLHSLLEKHKSDIQVEIRNEAKEVKNDIKELQSENEKKFESLGSQIDKQTSKVNLLLGISFVVLGVSVFLALKILGVA